VDTRRRLAEAAFLGGVALLPVMDPLHSHGSGSPVIPSDVLFGMAAVAWVLSRPRLPRGPFPTVALVYLGAVLLAVVTSEDRGHSLSRVVIDAYVVGLGVLTYSIARSHAMWRRLAGAWLVGTVISAVVIVVGLAFYAAGFDSQEKNIALSISGHAPVVLPRFHGLFTAPNLMCSYLIVSTAIVAVGWTTGLLSSRRAAVLAGGIAVSVFFSLSPGIGGVALAAGLAVWLTAAHPARWRGAVLCGAVIVALGFFGAAVATPRPTTWHQAFDAFIDRPLLGHGPGAEIVHLVVKEGTLTDAHQTWLNIAAQTGAVGALAFTAVVATLVLGVHRRRPLATHPALVACWSAVVGVLLYQGLTMSVEQMRHVWILLGALAAAVVDRSRVDVDSV
jgi:O-antigen ligase